MDDDLLSGASFLTLSVCSWLLEEKQLFFSFLLFELEERLSGIEIFGIYSLLPDDREELFDDVWWEVWSSHLDSSIILLN